MAITHKHSTTFRGNTPTLQGDRGFGQSNNIPVETPDTYSAPASPDRKKSRKGIIAAALSVGVAALSFIGIRAADNGSESRLTSRGAAATQPNRSSSTEATVYSYTPENDSTTGTLHLANILPGEQFLTFRRPESSVDIRVPKLRVNGTPTELSESGLALMAAYLTSGEQQFADALTSDKIGQNFLSNARDKLNIPYTLKNNPTSSDLQVSIFDSTSDPASFVESTDPQGRKTVTLDHGTIYLRTFWDTATHPENMSLDYNAWQGEASHTMQPFPQMTFTQLAFHLGKDTEGNTTVTKLDVLLVPNPAAN